MSGRRIDVRPLAGALGAEIFGVDLTKPLDNSVAVEIHQAFLDYTVIFFRDQDLHPAGLKEFARRFGPLGTTPFIKTMAEHPEIIEVVRAANPAKPAVNFGGDWHSDFSFLEEPPRATLLQAKEVPPQGGDTLFTNMYLAYETLSPGMKRMLEGLKAVHGAIRPYGPQGSQLTDEDSKEMVVKSSPEAVAERERPVVRTHPETGRKCLFINPVYTLRLSGMTRSESEPILNYLFKHAVRPEFTCRFRWETNSLALWDNRAVMHFAINDYLGHRRVMHRVTINGDGPL
ncbi:MAG TPA: TauD/TfdA family dioxygenase [Stellaceae bacterium]|nr:TauD/TfdA family dioxygenase [Stellaceae bacterium]